MQYANGMASARPKYPSDELENRMFRNDPTTRLAVIRPAAPTDHICRASASGGVHVTTESVEPDGISSRDCGEHDDEDQKRDASCRRLNNFRNLAIMLRGASVRGATQYQRSLRILAPNSFAIINKE